MVNCRASSKGSMSRSLSLPLAMPFGMIDGGGKVVGGVKVRGLRPPCFYIRKSVTAIASNQGGEKLTLRSIIFSRFLEAGDVATSGCNKNSLIRSRIYISSSTSTWSSVTIVLKVFKTLIYQFNTLPIKMTCELTLNG